jgi:hypothetical protein
MHMVEVGEKDSSIDEGEVERDEGGKEAILPKHTERGSTSLYMCISVCVLSRYLYPYEIYTRG